MEGKSSHTYISPTRFNSGTHTLHLPTTVPGEYECLYADDASVLLHTDDMHTINKKAAVEML